MSTMLDEILDTLGTVPDHHAPDSRLYRLMKQVARVNVESLFSITEASPQPFGPFGTIVFPYRQMGNVDSLNLFDMDELILFSFYWLNRERYKRVADIGANIGLHSLVLSRCGCMVDAYEPDPQHLDWLKSTLTLNGASDVNVVSSAVSDVCGTQEFIRVLGNTTGSHLAGAKASPYGRLERFPVDTVSIRDIIAKYDLLKIDAEGQERVILSATTTADWERTDAIVEVGGHQNAEAIFAHFENTPVRLFAQRSGWAEVRTSSEMPTSYRDGSLFISCRDRMPWSPDSETEISSDTQGPPASPNGHYVSPAA